MAIRKRKIQAMVEALLDENDVSDAPVPVLKIAEAHGARVFFNALAGDLSGFLYRDKSGAVIGVNTHHPEVRRNFTICHELGHLLLHDQEQLHVDHEFRVMLRGDESKKGTNDAEMEANFFAASLLMPKEFIEKDLADHESIDLFDDRFLKQLSKKYGVSSQALVYRLKNLGYIQE